ncbi:MAG: hypothetical protein IPN19_12895 [Elusimicrobia bacterium]|nr:hypothetical protein [Elusimicrobiota bacterium]
MTHEKNVLSKTGYAKLFSDLRKLWDAGRARARSAVNYQLLVTYWEMGGRIAMENLTANMGYEKAVLARLAKDMQTDVTTLYRCIQFHGVYKAVPRSDFLSWSHYRLCYAQHKRYYVGLALMLASLPPLTALFSFYTT